MTRNKTKHSLPYALVSSTLGTTLVSFVAAWLVASSPYGPMTTGSDSAGAGHTHSHSSPSSRLYQLSPIPPGADWTS